MACNENVIKNIANEITRNCQALNVTVDPEFVIYIIELLLLNPKYGKLFAKTINRNNLQYFVDECVSMLSRGDTPTHTLKMQFIMQTNYDKLQNLVDKHIESINTCLKPLVTEILEEQPSMEDDNEFKKLFRKISIYIILCSGLGNPGHILTLKEGMAALESVFSLDDLVIFTDLPRMEKLDQLEELLKIVSGVRLFNRDCNKGGEGIADCGDTPTHTLKMQFIMQTNYDKLQNLVDKHIESINTCLKPLVTEILEEQPSMEDDNEFKKLFRKISIYIILCSGLVPHNLVDAGKACLASLSNSLITVMQRVNSLTTAIEDKISIDEDTGNVVIDLKPGTEMSVSDVNQIIDLLSFYRQYEVFTRRLLSDVQIMVCSAGQHVDRVKLVLEDLHKAVKYKSAVPVITVFPLFSRLWQVWRSMQNIMYLISTVNRLTASLASIQDQMKVPHNIVDKMLQGKHVITDQDRISTRLSVEERISMASLRNYVAYSEPGTIIKDRKEKYSQYLGFCAMCLGVGALVPGNIKVGFIKSQGRRYTFCTVKMASKFSKDPERYIGEALDYARNNPHVINLLNLIEDVRKVRDIDVLVVKPLPKILMLDRDIQTVPHPIDEYVEKDYTWDMWELKRRACKWATIVNCKTHSTQTIYSHLRSDIQCQTTEPRDKCMQTKKDCGMNTQPYNVFLWGLRGQLGDGQHSMPFVEHHSDRLKAKSVEYCKWPCTPPPPGQKDTGVQKDEDDMEDLLHSPQSIATCSQPS